MQPITWISKGRQCTRTIARNGLPVSASAVVAELVCVLCCRVHAIEIQWCVFRADSFYVFAFIRWSVLRCGFISMPSEVLSKCACHLFIYLLFNFRASNALAYLIPMRLPILHNTWLRVPVVHYHFCLSRPKRFTVHLIYACFYRGASWSSSL